MTGSPASISVLALAGYLVSLGLLATVGPVYAQSVSSLNEAVAEQAPFTFNIPAQPLADAIKAYGLITGLSVLAASGTLRQRTSTALLGSYSAEDALQRMLEGTALQVRFPQANAATIYLPPDAVHAGTAPPQNSSAIELAAIDAVRSGGADYRPYVSAVQTHLVQALCQVAPTRPGSYRLAVRLRIGASGAVTSAKHSGSTGDPARDAGIARALRTLTFDPPPPAMPQPVTLLLRPDGAGVTTICPTAATQSRVG